MLLSGGSVGDDMSCGRDPHFERKMLDIEAVMIYALL
jgi:hypothetical protein